MKILCYFVLIIAFLMVYQKNPVYALIIISMMITLFLLFKLRKDKNKGGNFFGFSKAKKSDRDNEMNDLFTLLMYQKIFNFSGSKTQNPENEPFVSDKRKEREEVEKIKQEILELLVEE